MSPESVAAEDYRRLLEFRTGIRRFLKWSADRAKEAGLTPAQHQLLLAVKGHDDAAGPTISDVAEYLQLRHNSTVELIDRAEHLGLVRRVTDSEDARLVRLQLTEDGDTRLKGLAHQHLRELERLAAHISQLWAGLD
jgi:DNA-binding MarR family transcriptional regulator